MRPTLRQLQYLIAIAETGRFSDAARRVHVSQPSLSDQIAELEMELGVVLIERSRKGAMLTPAGEEAVRRARRILRAVEDLKASMQGGADTLAGEIRLGVLPTVGPYLLPGAARRLHSDYPKLRLIVREERTRELSANLDSGALDAVVSAPDEHPNRPFAPIVTETLWVCCAPDDPLAQGSGEVRLDDLQRRTLLSLGPGHQLSRLVYALAAAAGARVNPEYEGTSLDAVRQMAEMGAGVAILPSLYALTEARRDPDLRVRPIAHKPARRDLALIWRASSPLAPRFSRLGAVLREEAEAIVAQA